MPMELVFVIGMAVLLILCIKVKANAFISLLATALVMGMLSGMSGADTVSAITSGFSGTVKSIGIVIIFGIMLGQLSGRGQKVRTGMAYDAVKLVGQKRAGLAMAITGYIVSIPVFFGRGVRHPDPAGQGYPQENEDPSCHSGRQPLCRSAVHPRLRASHARPSGCSGPSGHRHWPCHPLRRIRRSVHDGRRLDLRGALLPQQA